MSNSILSKPYFHNEEAAYEFVEARLWANGRACPHCGVIGESSKMQGKSTRIGAYKCYACRKPFTVKIGTIFEASHVRMNVWLQAIFLIASSKKGISTNQLHRTLGLTLKSAWFVGHRIREAMKSSDISFFGSDGGDVEVDETFIGHDPAIKPRNSRKGRGYAHKNKVLALVERNTGKARSIVVDDLKVSTLLPILKANISPNARILTDEASHYFQMREHFRAHDTVEHGAKEYVNLENPSIHTNTIEGFFSVFKRGMKGVYQHCGHQHLNRYLHEFDFRYSNRKALGIEDTERAEKILAGVVGKRLTYRRTM